MKKIRILVLLLFCSTLLYSQDLACEYNEDRFQAGEVLKYRLYYNWKFVWIPAGEVKFSIAEEDSDYLIEVVGKTFDSYNSFFEVDDYFFSRIDKKTGIPKNFIRKIQEGNYYRYDSIAFFHENNSARGILGKSKDTAEPYEEKLSYCAHDIISILYNVRNQDLQNMEKGKLIPFSVFFDREEFDLKLEIGKSERKKIKGLGKHETIKLIPEVVAGEVFDENSKMNIWVSNDKNRIPLLIESPVSIGSVKAVLTEATGLKNPISYQN